MGWRINLIALPDRDVIQGIPDHRALNDSLFQTSTCPLNIHNSIPFKDIHNILVEI